MIIERDEHGNTTDIGYTWSKEDIQYYAQQMIDDNKTDCDLTSKLEDLIDDEIGIGIILENMDSNYDRETGITWEYIEAEIGNYLEEMY